MFKKAHDVNLVGKNTDIVKVNSIIKRCLVSLLMLRKLF